jgi:hypothetical protein
MNKKVVFSLVFILSLWFGIHQLLDSISTNYFSLETLSVGRKVDVAFEYTNIFKKLGLVSDKDTIAVAVSYARNSEVNFLANMKRGGRTVALLLSIARDKESSHAIQAAYEALVLLIRMPMDESLAPIANQFSQQLASAITDSENTPTDWEKFQVREVLAMFAVRARPNSPTQLVADLKAPSEMKDAGWLSKLAQVRVGFASCVQSETDYPEVFLSALHAEFPVEWLKHEARLGWDVPFMDAVIISSKSSACIERAQKLKSLITS